MEPSDRRLQLLREQTARRRQLEIRLKSLKDQRRDLSARERELAAARAAEQSDVDRLEGRSLAAYFYRLSGSLDDRLDRERAEAYQAAVRHDAVRRELDEVEREAAEAEDELRGLAGSEERYRAALAEKAEALKAAGSPAGSRLLELEKRLNDLTGQRRELREAQDAGQAAWTTADGILNSLGSAEGWGTWDLLGGGLLTDLAKHSHLDEAQRQVETLQAQLRRFRTELADVTIHAEMQVQIDGFLRFADYFFDGLFADWAVLDRIHNSQEQIVSTRRQIGDVLSRLDGMSAAAAREAEDLQAAWCALVAEA